MAGSEEELGIFTAFLKYDLLLHDGRVRLPDWAESDTIFEDFNEWRYNFLADEKNLERFLPHMAGKSVKDILKQVRFETFDYDPTTDSRQKGTYIVLFDYSKRHTGTVLLCSIPC